MRWIALLLAGSAWAADFPMPEFVPPGTTLVMGIQLRRILDSPLGKRITEDAGHAAIAAQAQFGGIDFLKDVDQMLLATSGTGKETPALIVMKGRFHETEGQRYHGVSILTVPQHPDQLLAIVDPSTAIGGTVALVHAAIDRRGDDSARSPEMAQRIAALAGQYDVWGLGDHLPPSGEPGQLDSVDAFSFGAALRDGLHMNAEVHLRSAADAAKMTASIRMLQAMIQSQSGATQFHLAAEGSTLKLAVEIPEAELKKGIEAQKAAIAAAVMGQMSAAKPQLGKLRIEKPKAEAKIVTNEKGETVHITLPGKSN